MSGELRIKDFKTREIEGTTNAVADTKSLFRHASPSAPGAPTAWNVLEGDVYIPYEGAGPEVVDVRSRLTSHRFRILFFY